MPEPTRSPAGTFSFLMAIVLAALAVLSFALGKVEDGRFAVVTCLLVVVLGNQADARAAIKAAKESTDE